MKTSEYLYGVSPSLFAGENYETVLNLKIAMGIHMLKKIREGSRDEDHYVAVEKAIAFNRQLLEELNE